ncbi:hypothetical protein BH09PSE2_BH09PSE2_09680 [soil metagenome]
MSVAPKLRCALYTRKSSEEGLDQAFNSLHAQREACEAYVLSQAGEGWKASPVLYDDGGFSGGSMDRPALHRLLEDVRARRIDVVVVYKVDRLTRSLGDFGRIIEAVDGHGVRCGSVTQAFNTTTSMGRLTLNVLLSFAQFEREVTGERIRDKIAASKAKGMWMGGVPPLGYRPKHRTLEIVEGEAEQVRAVFSRYLQVGSVHRLKDELEARGVRSRSGAVINRGALFHLLKNRIYVGEIVHKELVHPGLHPPLLDRTLFDAVQAKLALQTPVRGRKAASAQTSILKGKLFDVRGRRMTPVFTHRGDRVYRYYASLPLQLGVRLKDDPTLSRLPAPVLEAFVEDQLGRLVPDRPFEVILRRVDLRDRGIELVLEGSELDQNTTSALRAKLDPADEVQHLDDGRVRITLQHSFVKRGGKRRLVSSDGSPLPAPRRQNPTLVRGLKSARSLRAKIERDEPLKTSYERRLAAIAFLAPLLQDQILDGAQPPHASLEDYISIAEEPCWSVQVARAARL